MLNTITLCGRLTRDPELKSTNNGLSVCTLSLAVGRDTKNSSGDYDTDFIDCVAWRQSAEYAAKTFSKGSICLVTGRLQMREWEDKNGNKRKTAEVVADHVYSVTKSEKPSREVTFTDIDEVEGELPF